MPLARPTLTQLINRVASDIEARIGGNAKDQNVKLERSFESVIARVVSGIAHSLYGGIEYASNQVFPTLALGSGLDLLAENWGVTRAQPIAAIGTIRFTGVNATNIPAATSIQTDDGVQYQTDSLGVIAGGYADVSVTAVDTGVLGNRNQGEVLTLVSPIVNVDNECTVQAGGLSGGTNLESDAELRSRIILRLKNPQRYGAPGDFVQWALENSNVTRAWEYPRQYGAGTIEVFAVNDNAASKYLSSGELAVLKTYIGDRMITMIGIDDLFVSTPTQSLLNITMSLTPNTASVQANVKKSVDDFIEATAVPGGTILLSQLNEAISLAIGEEDHTMTIPSADVAEDYGDITELGVITFV